MNRIFKYALGIPLDANGTVSLSLPRGAEILSCQAQAGLPCVWAIVDPEQPSEEREFQVLGTGWPIVDPGRFIATFQLAEGALVFHIFEKIGGAK